MKKNLTKTRQGLDINLELTIMRGELPEDLIDVDNLKVTIEHVNYSNCALANAFKLTDRNTLKIRVKGEYQYKAGCYRLVVSYTKRNPDREPNSEPFIVDAMAFEIVPYSDMVAPDNGGCPNLSVSQINLTATIDISKTSGDGGGGGTDGVDGVTFTPTVKAEGNILTLSWTNNGNLENPTPVTVEAPQGAAFAYEDFTAAQLLQLKGSAFTYSDFTAEQLATLKGDRGLQGESGKMKNTISTEATPTLEAKTGNTYEYNELTSLQVSFVAPTDLTTVNRVVIKFISGATATTVTLQQPDGIIKDADFEVKANQYCTLDFEYAWGKWVLFDRPITKAL